MKAMKTILPRALGLLGLSILVCGVLYTGAVTGLAQLLFPHQANGSIIEVDGVKYGSALMGQQYAAPNHMWGRPANADVSTYTDENGNALLYAAPSNLSPAGGELEAQVAARVQRQREANPEMGDTPVPVDLVTASGSGLDPHISPAAAAYQVPRLARENGLSEDEVRQIIAACTDGKFLGVFGEETVNVLQVNLMLEGIL
ncbi:potassium-transporting ATPase subunit KdpC [Agathobaculum sp.]|uniref:potassium-transporting ATPase subunit KdpC n=1 Tax=Agathobaculum sp. TaxID=2048138 RepID=UPI002A7FA701|nr:potassium-transporting ATPase subunit KdpC [Agathobaculum sp.]MDY3619405.1 potassium-transporting ATPase subunit KdpC [Agathobaculum sp.]